MASPGGSDDGHCVAWFDYNERGVIANSWGFFVLITWEAVAKYWGKSAGGEVYAVFSPDVAQRDDEEEPDRIQRRAARGRSQVVWLRVRQCLPRHQISTTSRQPPAGSITGSTCCRLSRVRQPPRPDSFGGFRSSFARYDGTWTKFDARMTALELDRQRIEVMLASLPTRDNLAEMRASLNRQLEHITGRLDDFVHIRARRDA